MVLKLNRVFIVIGSLMLAGLACGVGPAALPPSTDPVGAAVTHALETITALASISPAASAEVGFTVTPGAIPTTAELPPALTFTPLPTDIPTITFTSSPSVPIVHVTNATFCRTGPGMAYGIVTTADIGFFYEVIGKYTPEGYWIIIVPGAGQCWLWGQFAIVDGPVGGLQEYALPPTPAPVSGFIVVSVTGPRTSGVNDAFIKNATVEIRSIGMIAENQGDGTYKFSNVPPGATDIIAKAPSYTFGFGSVNVAGGQTRQIQIRLLWESPTLHGCSSLPTIQERLKCYQGIHLPTFVPPVQP